MIEQTYKLSMIPFEEQVRRNYEIPIVPASQYDKTLRTLSFELYNGEDRFTIPTEAVVYIFGMKPDGNAFQYQMTVEDNMAKIAMQTQMTTVAGCVTCEIVLFEENTAGPRIGSANFKLMVEKCAVGDDAEFSRSDMPVIQTLIFGGMVGDVLVKDANGVKWNSESLSTGYMRYDQYDPDRTGTVDSARDSETVDGHTVARNVLADEYSNAEIDTKVNAVNTRIDNQIGSYTVERNVLSGEYTNTEIDGKVQAVQDDVDALDSSAVKSVNTITPINGNVTLSKSDVGLGNVDNTSDLSKPISTATQSALDEKVDKVTGKGLSTNDFTNQWRNKLEGIEAGAEVNVQANWDQTIATADDYIKNKPSIPENTSDLVNDSGFITAALAPVQGVKGSAESAYRTGNVSISKENIGLGNVDNTSDVDKPISTAVQTALDGKQATLTFDSIPTAGSTNPVTSDGIATEISALNSNLSQKVSSVNSETPDTNGNVSLNAEDIPADGIGSKEVSGNPIIITDGVAENAQNLSVELEPIQDLNGYDHPWAGGAGKNLLPMTVDGIKAANTTGTWNGNVYTYSGCTYEILTDDASNVIGIKVNGTSIVNAVFWLGMIDYVENTNMSVNSGVQTGSSSEVFFRISGWGKQTYTVSAQSSGNDKSFSFDTSGELWGNIRIGRNEQLTNMIFRPYLFLASNPMTSFEPYANICPITGRTQVEITNKDSEDAVLDSVTVNLGQTVYGGTLNVTTGELTVETANIASYNGESIGEPWWSSMDEYVAGTTPTTGAQVVFTLATPTTVSLTPAQIALLEGYNILNTDGDALNLRYTGTVASNVQSEIDEFEESTRKLAGSIAMIETSPATANHAVGDYLMLDNRLCKVTSAIATGEQIIVGSNVQYTTVAEELAAILAQINA